MIGVSASASRPISTLSRVISNALPAVAKLWPATAEDDALGDDHDEEHPLVVGKEPLAEWRRARQRATTPARPVGLP
jgi:hypothetical protein